MSASPVSRRDFLRSAGASAVAAPTAGFAASERLSGPAYLNAHSAAWASRRGAALVFGGADERHVLNELWRYRRGDWRLISSSGPLPRTFPAAAYDSRRDRLVVFGGNKVLFGDGSRADTVLGDHWEWNGRRWIRFEGACPPSRTEAALAFDAARGRLVLFGGWRWAGDQRLRLDDLWEFDGQAWIRLPTSGPEPRSGAVMTYDSVQRRMLLAGGNGPRRDFWAYDGSIWERLPDIPQARFNPALAFQHAHNRTVLFGGWTGKERVAATALFDGREWRPHAGLEPASRNHSVLVPIGDGSRLLLIGGHNGDDVLRVLGDQWEWSTRWRPLRIVPPKPRIPNSH